MKKIFLISALIFSLSFVSFAKSEFDFKVEKVEMHQTETDSISVDIFVNIVKEKIKKKNAMVLQGFLLVGKETIPLKAASFYTFDGSGKRFNPRKGYDNVSGYKDEMFFASGKSVGKFTMHSIITMPAGIDACGVLMMLTERSYPDKSTVLSAQEVAHFYHKMKPTVKPRFYYLPAPDDRSENHIEKASMHLVFDEGKNTYDNNAGMNQKESFDFIQSVSSIIADSRTKVSSVSFNGYVGIEGPERANMTKCQARTQSVYKYLTGKKAFRNKKVLVNSKGEDWKSVDDWVANSYWGRDKEYENLISRTSNKDARERALREQYPALWEALSQKLFPQIERFESVLIYTVNPFASDEDILKAYNVDRRLLCQYDFYRLMDSQKMYSDKWFDILTDWVEQYPYSKPALVNISAAYIACGQLREANEYLRLLGDSEDARYYKSLWFYYQGDFDSAFELASSLNPKNPAFGSYLQQLSEYKNWKFNSFTRTREE